MQLIPDMLAKGQQILSGNNQGTGFRYDCVLQLQRPVNRSSQGCGPLSRGKIPGRNLRGFDYPLGSGF